MTDEITQGREPSRPPAGGGHRRTLVMAGIVLAFLVAVIVVGAIRGQPSSTPRASGTPTPSADVAATGSDASTGPPLQLTAVRCARLAGGRLTVAFGVANRGAESMTISRLVPSFPIGGLTIDTTGVPDGSSCPAPTSPVPDVVGPGGEALLAVVLTPTDPRCVAPLVVDMTVRYAVGTGAAHDATLRPFPDLGNLGLPSVCG